MQGWAWKGMQMQRGSGLGSSTGAVQSCDGALQPSGGVMCSEPMCHEDGNRVRRLCCNGGRAQLVPGSVMQSGIRTVVMQPGACLTITVSHMRLMTLAGNLAGFEPFQSLYSPIHSANKSSLALSYVVGYARPSPCTAAAVGTSQVEGLCPHSACRLPHSPRSYGC